MLGGLKPPISRITPLAALGGWEAEVAARVGGEPERCLEPFPRPSEPRAWGGSPAPRAAATLAARARAPAADPPFCPRLPCWLPWRGRRPRVRSCWRKRRSFGVRKHKAWVPRRGIRRGGSSIEEEGRGSGQNPVEDVKRRTPDFQIGAAWGRGGGGVRSQDGAFPLRFSLTVGEIEELKRKLQNALLEAERLRSEPRPLTTPLPRDPGRPLHGKFPVAQGAEFESQPCPSGPTSPLPSPLPWWGKRGDSEGRMRPGLVEPGTSPCGCLSWAHIFPQKRE